MAIHATITQERLKELLTYDKEAGVLICRRYSHPGRWKKGREAGCPSWKCNDMSVICSQIKKLWPEFEMLS